MSNLIDLQQQIPSNTERSRMIFSGDVLIFRQVPAIKTLCQIADEIAQEIYETEKPFLAQLKWDPEIFQKKVFKLKKSFSILEASRKALKQFFEEMGCLPLSTYVDCILLRIYPYGSSHNGKHTGKLTPHRDTWGSNIYEQINWWAPIYPLTPERTLAYLPEYWLTAVKNSSGSWNNKDFIKSLKTSLDQTKAVPYPSAPLLEEELNYSSETLLLPEPGDIIAFSGSHLHYPVGNKTDQARFNFEFRSIHKPDFLHQRSAPNVDGAGTEKMFSWFTNIINGTHYCP